MKFSLFPGCIASSEQFACELSAREVLPRLGIELMDLQGASCCGYPFTGVTSPISWTYLTARNTALAERNGAGLLPLCNTCHLSFCEVRKDLRENTEQMVLINDNLSAEGLRYTGDLEIVHLLEVLYDEVGLKKIKRKVTKPLENLKLAAHPGCHAFRPRTLKRPDDNRNPRKLNELIEILGAESPDYPEKLDCCGSYMLLRDEKSALKMAGMKLKSIKEAGFDGLVTTCPMCFKIFDSKQDAISRMLGNDAVKIPVMYYTQLLGSAMDIANEKLGLHLNLSPIEKLCD